MAVKRYNGTAWDTVAGLGAQGTAATSSSITTWVKTASGGETSLTGSSDSSTTLAYTAGQEQLFINGVLKVRGSDYTATNGTSITGLAALTAGDIATVTTVNAFSVTGAVPLSTVTANGDLIVGTSSGAVGRLGIGSTDQVLKVSGGVPTWATPASSGFPAWTSYTPTVVCTVGSITSYAANGWSSQSGKTVVYQGTVTISNAGTGAGTLVVTLPIVAQTRASANWMGTAIEGNTTGYSGWASVLSAASAVNIRNYLYQTMIGTGNQIAFTVTYEVA